MSAGRKTLHGHWLFWVKAYQRLREMLFNHNKSVQAAARKRFIEYVDLVMSSSLASFNKITSLPMDSLQVSHSCGMKESALSSAQSAENEDDVLDSKQSGSAETAIEDFCGTANELFYDYKHGSPEEDDQLQRIRNTRSKHKKDEIRGEILHCNICKAMFSPQEVIGLALLYYKNDTKSAAKLPTHCN